MTKVNAGLYINGPAIILLGLHGPEGWCSRGWAGNSPTGCTCPVYVYKGSVKGIRKGARTEAAREAGWAAADLLERRLDTW